MNKFLETLKIIFLFVLLPGGVLLLIYRAIYVLAGIEYISPNLSTLPPQSLILRIANWSIPTIVAEVGYYGGVGGNLNSYFDWNVFFYGLNQAGFKSLYLVPFILISPGFYEGLISQTNQVN